MPSGAESTDIRHSGKRGPDRNTTRLDCYAPNREAQVERLIGLGATRLWDVKNEDFEWTTLADVEGNEFCVVQAKPLMPTTLTLGSAKHLRPATDLVPGLPPRLIRG
jgi:glyoxalase superfamily protein